MFDDKQKSVRFFDPANRGAPADTPDLYWHMFREDVVMGIVPIGGIEDRRAPWVKLSPADENAEVALAAALSDDHYGYGLSSAVGDFVQDCVRALLEFGETAYELVDSTMGQNAEPGAKFRFEMIQHATWSRRSDGGIRQRIPRDVARRLALPEIVEIDAQHSMVFAPIVLQNFRISQVKDALRQLSDSMIPRFAIENMELSSAPEFDFKRYNRTLKEAIAQVTKETGWTARSLLGNDVLEYYQIYRWLKFERFKIILRSQVIDSLNQALIKAGGILGFSASAKIEGIPNLEDADTALFALERGSRSFKELMAPFLRW
jgi:hypothetical protein